MSENQKNKKPADPPDPAQGLGQSKSYEELLKGFAEIHRLQANQEEFNRRTKTGSKSEKKEKPADKQENPDS